MKFEVRLEIFIFIFCAAIAISRFYNLSASPPGVYSDESAAAMNAVCIGQIGQDAFGNSWPVFAQALGGGVNSPTRLYINAIWAKLFGPSIKSFRALSAVITILTIMGLMFVAGIFLPPIGEAFTLLAASVSPWGWNMGHSFMDDTVLMPCFIVWGVYFFLRARKSYDGLVASLFLALAMYTYPSARVSVPLLVLLLFLFRIGFLSHRPLKLFTFLFLIGFIIFVTPLGLYIIWGRLSERYAIVGILTQSYLEANGGYTTLNFLKIFVKNLFKHFDPKFLFISGDGNLRHNSQFSGQMSWLDMWALILFPILGFKNKKLLGLPLLFIAGYVICTVPSALTWESIPHALRSVGSWPFLSLFTGFVLFWAYRDLSRWTSVAAVALAFSFQVGLMHHYFTIFPEQAKPWFDHEVMNAALVAQQTGDWQKFMDDHNDYHQVSSRYFMVLYRHMSCVETAQEFITINQK